MKIENPPKSHERTDVVAANWAEIIGLICAHGYRFAERQNSIVTPIGLGQRFWELILNFFGKNSRRQRWEKDNAANSRVQWNKQLSETHSCVAYIINSAQKSLTKSDLWKMAMDYTGMGTMFFKTDIEIKRISINPEKFTVIIDLPRST